MNDAGKPRGVGGAAPRRWLDIVYAVETSLLVGLVLALIGLAAGQIIARTLFDSGWAWLDPLSRVLVLWTGMLGALAAARDDRHISLDALSRLLPAKARRIARVFTLGFAAAVSAALCWYSIGLVELDRESGIFAFGEVPAWQVELILPVAFALLTLRFLVRSVAAPMPEDRQ